MDKETRQNLVVELTRNIEYSRHVINTTEEMSVGYKRYTVNLDFYKGYITKEECSDLFNLYEFLKNNKEIDKPELKKILSMNRKAFTFLRRLNKQFTDLIEELREHGPVWILTCYCGDKRFKETCHYSIFD